MHLIPSVNSEIAAPAFQIVERSPIEKGGLGTVKKERERSGSGCVPNAWNRYLLSFINSMQKRPSSVPKHTRSVSIIVAQSACLICGLDSVTSLAW